MIDKLLGFDLAGRGDPGLARGMFFGILAAACAVGAGLRLPVVRRSGSGDRRWRGSVGTGCDQRFRAHRRPRAGGAPRRRLAELGIFLIEYRFARRALGTIRDFTSEPLQPLAEEPRKPVGTRIVIDRVGFSHADEPTLKGVSLTIEEGEMAALVGPSGSGKSTLVSLIARLWDVDSGSIRIGGVDVRDMAPETLNATVSMVLQDVALFDVSVEDNIRLGRPNASFDEVKAAAIAARIHDRILELPEGYSTVLAGAGAQLSGGVRQRLAIARALLTDAPILVLDEATASIDLDNERLIQEALENLTAGRTVIVIAHRLWTVTEADRIAVLDRGRLVETGRHEGLVAAGGLYERLWNSQKRSRGWRINAS
ncbi:ABC transporter ATP-binding protein [Rhizobiaceae sp. 2RAB30]